MSTTQSMLILTTYTCTTSDGSWALCCTSTQHIPKRLVLRWLMSVRSYHILAKVMALRLRCVPRFSDNVITYLMHDAKAACARTPRNSRRDNEVAGRGTNTWNYNLCCRRDVITFNWSVLSATEQRRFLLLNATLIGPTIGAAKDKLRTKDHRTINYNRERDRFGIVRSGAFIYYSYHLSDQYFKWDGNQIQFSNDPSHEFQTLKQLEQCCTTAWMELVKKY